MNKTITQEKYPEYMTDYMDYKTFYIRTYKIASDGGFYDYCVNKENDNDKNRLSYISYLVNEKGYDL